MLYKMAANSQPSVAAATLRIILRSHTIASKLNKELKIRDRFETIGLALLWFPASSKMSSLALCFGTENSSSLSEETNNLTKAVPIKVVGMYCNCKFARIDSIEVTKIKTPNSG